MLQWTYGATDYKIWFDVSIDIQDYYFGLIIMDEFLSVINQEGVFGAEDWDKNGVYFLQIFVD